VSDVLYLTVGLDASDRPSGPESGGRGPGGTVGRAGCAGHIAIARSPGDRRRSPGIRAGSCGHVRGPGRPGRDRGGTASFGI